jgi:predicted thioredoxin/glutaredoxin
MPLYTISEKQIGLKVFQLATHEDMWAAVKWLAAKGYAAHVNYADANQSWSLWFSKGAMNASANMTDGIVLENDAVVRGVVSAADFPALYQVV